jgi:c(7)-type cytochrome triheme protein
MVGATTASCTFVNALLPSASVPPRPFNHAAHQERGVDCNVCHELADSRDEAGMPSKDVCMGCHEDVDKDPKKKREETVAWFLDDRGNPVWSAFTKQAAEVKFTHKEHAAKKIACATCHRGIEKDTGLTPDGKLQRMDSCVACHAGTVPSKNECSTCHEALDRDVAPKSHAMAWKGTHGVCSKAGKAASTANDCSMCHQKNECQSCHATEAPADHNNFWRIRGHGAVAGMSRDRCTTCHASDACVRCHQETAPVSHAAGWAGAQARHCMGCHVPLQKGSGCAVCHQETPGHLAAPAKPAWHNAAMNCRGCHATSLKHPDNGDNCNACHQ